MQSDYLNPIQTPSAVVHAPSAKGGRVQHPETAQREDKTSRVKEVVLRAVWESLCHMLPLAIALYPHYRARPLLPALPFSP